MRKVICNYCGKPAHLVLGPDLYPHRPDLAHVKAWRCSPCDAQVACHDGTDKPKGTLANRTVKAARQRAHSRFDGLWKNWKQAYPGNLGAPDVVLRRIQRDRAYRWLTVHMGAAQQVHIGEMDEAQCARVVELVTTLKPTPVSIRAWAKTQEPRK